MTARSLIAALLLSLATTVLTGCVDDGMGTSPSSRSAPSDPATVEDGRAIAEAQCSRCHAIGLEGMSPNPAAPVFRTILSRYDQDVLERELIDGMGVAHKPMPQFQFDPQGTDALIAYLRSIQVTSPGRLLVEERCARCHAIGRNDTSPYPGAQPYRNLGQRWTRAQLRDALRSGIIAEHDASGVRFQMKLTDQEIDDFLDFLKSIETPDHPAPR
ncbi:MAG: c-type cytochrome [Alphaproteobacteria bacterium]|nr:c-type cytochrome [Alphaproteobacteria bacterium]